MIELNPASIKYAERADSDLPDSNMVEVLEIGGNFTLRAGKSRLDEALAHNEKFIAVKVAGSEPGGEDSFMNFVKMVKP